MKKIDPELELPQGDFGPYYVDSREAIEANATLVARAIHKLGPTAEARYLARLRELLASEGDLDRRFAAYAIGSFGPEGRGESAALLKVVEQPVGFAESDAGTAALALVKIGDLPSAARAFAAMLARRNYRSNVYFDDNISPLDEIKKLPPQAVKDLPAAVKEKLGIAAKPATK